MRSWVIKALALLFSFEAAALPFANGFENCEPPSGDALVAARIYETGESRREESPAEGWVVETREFRICVGRLDAALLEGRVSVNGVERRVVTSSDPFELSFPAGEHRVEVVVSGPDAAPLEGESTASLTVRVADLGVASTLDLVSPVSLPDLVPGPMPLELFVGRPLLFLGSQGRPLDAPVSVTLRLDVSGVSGTQEVSLALPVLAGAESSVVVAAAFGDEPPILDAALSTPLSLLTTSGTLLVDYGAFSAALPVAWVPHPRAAMSDAELANEIVDLLRPLDLRAASLASSVPFGSEEWAGLNAIASLIYTDFAGLYNVPSRGRMLAINELFRELVAIYNANSGARAGQPITTCSEAFAFAKDLYARPILRNGTVTALAMATFSLAVADPSRISSLIAGAALGVAVLSLYDIYQDVSSVVDAMYTVCTESAGTWLSRAAFDGARASGKRLPTNEDGLVPPEQGLRLFAGRAQTLYLRDTRALSPLGQASMTLLNGVVKEIEGILVDTGFAQDASYGQTALRALRALPAYSVEYASVGRRSAQSIELRPASPAVALAVTHMPGEDSFSVIPSASRDVLTTAELVIDGVVETSYRIAVRVPAGAWVGSLRITEIIEDPTCPTFRPGITTQNCSQVFHGSSYAQTPQIIAEDSGSQPFHNVALAHLVGGSITNPVCTIYSDAFSASADFTWRFNHFAPDMFGTGAFSLRWPVEFSVTERGPDTLSGTFSGRVRAFEAPTHPNYCFSICQGTFTLRFDPGTSVEAACAGRTRVYPTNP